MNNSEIFNKQAALFEFLLSDLENFGYTRFTKSGGCRWRLANRNSLNKDKRDLMKKYSKNINVHRKNKNNKMLYRYFIRFLGTKTRHLLFSKPKYANFLLKQTFCCIDK